MTSETILPVHSPSLNPTYPPMAAANHAEKPAQDASATAHGVARLTVHIPSAFRPNAARAKLGDAKRVSRLASIEFRIYYVVVALAIPAMVWIPMALSDRERPACVVHRGAEIDRYSYYSFAPELPFLRGEAVARVDQRPRSCEFRVRWGVGCGTADVRRTIVTRNTARSATILAYCARLRRVILL